MNWLSQNLPVILALATLGVCVVLAVVINNIWARLSLIEVYFNEGLPPGLRPTTATSTQIPPQNSAHTGADSTARTEAHTFDIRETLGQGLSIFVSRSCPGCQRLLDELATLDKLDNTTLYYIDEPNKGNLELLDKLGVEIETGQSELAELVGAKPLPYAFTFGPYSLADSAVVVHLDALRELCANAGLENLKAPNYLIDHGGSEPNLDS